MLKKLLHSLKKVASFFKRQQDSTDGASQSDDRSVTTMTLIRMGITPPRCPRVIIRTECFIISSSPGVLSAEKYLDIVDWLNNIEPSDTPVHPRTHSENLRNPPAPTS